MSSKLKQFKNEMAPAKEIYKNELMDFAKKYDFLGEMSLREEPDLDTQDYIFTFEKLNGTSEKLLDSTLNELYTHMEEFSKSKGIDKFCRNATITYAW